MSSAKKINVVLASDDESFTRTNSVRSKTSFDFLESVWLWMTLFVLIVMLKWGEYVTWVVCLASLQDGEQNLVYPLLVVLLIVAF